MPRNGSSSSASPSRQSRDSRSVGSRAPSSAEASAEDRGRSPACQGQGLRVGAEPGAGRRGRTGGWRTEPCRRRPRTTGPRSAASLLPAAARSGPPAVRPRCGRAPAARANRRPYAERPPDCTGAVGGPPLSLVAGEGFEPSKAEPADLQSAPFGHSGNPPGIVSRSPVRRGKQYPIAGGWSATRLIGGFGGFGGHPARGGGRLRAAVDRLGRWLSLVRGGRHPPCRSTVKETH